MSRPDSTSLSTPPRWLAFLGGARFRWVAGLVAVALAAPSLWGGLQTEDHLHREVSQTVGPVNLFGSAGDVMKNYVLKDAGHLPWITVEDWRVVFWRPLSSWTHYLDYQAFPETPWLMHAHSLAWLFALVLAAGALYRRFDWAPWIAGLATLLYGIDDGHGPAVGWLANRSVLVASTFAVLAVWAHDRWRSAGWRPGVVVAPTMLWLALHGGEIAVGAVGYLISHALVLDRARGIRRAASTLPWLVALATWAVPYRLLGFGTHGSAAYVDPLGDPAGYAMATVTRLPVLFHGLVSAPSTDFVVVLERWHDAFLAWGVVSLALVALGLVGLVRRDRLARFWLLGALLSLLPACTAVPSDRLLFLPGLGAMGLVAMVVAHAWSRRRAPRSWCLGTERVLAGYWVVVHVIAAAVLLPYRSFGLRAHEQWIADASRSAFARVTSVDQQLIIVNAPDFYSGSLIVGVRKSRGELVPHRVRVLYGGDETVWLTGIDEHTVLVRPARGFLIPKMNAVYRSKDHPMKVGDGLQLTGALIRVAEVDTRGLPMAATFRFRPKLTDDELVWMMFDGSSYRQLVPPAPRETIEVPGIELEPF